MTDFLFTVIIFHRTIKIFYRKGGKRMNGNGNRKEGCFCPTCGRQKEENRLVCEICFKEYLKEADETTGTGEKLFIFPWAMKKALATLPHLEDDLLKIKDEMSNLNRLVMFKAGKAVEYALSGKDIQLEERQRIFQQKKEELWRINGGSAKFAEFKAKEERVDFIKQTFKKSVPLPPIALHLTRKPPRRKQWPEKTRS